MVFYKEVFLASCGEISEVIDPVPNEMVISENLDLIQKQEHSWDV